MPDPASSRKNWDRFVSKSGAAPWQSTAQRLWLGGGKRTFDTLAVLGLAPITLPVVLVLALIVRVIDGPAPLFRQRRIGHRARPFLMLKLRTMHSCAHPPPEWAFAGWTAHHDPRVTPLGRTLRRYRLDEMPQLWNVLRGDMSLVGPRPETPDVSAHLEATLDGYRERYRVRPGLTGLCQISADYSTVGTLESAARKLQHDRRYVASISPGLDMIVLARTVRVLVAGRGVC